MLLITGATGQLGQAVLAQLLRRTAASQLAAFVRDEAKAAPLREAGVSLRLGDYDNRPALDRAMQGVEKVLLIAGTDEERRVQQHAAVIDAAQRAGVRCLAYTSRTLRDPTTLSNQLMLGHFQTEDYLRASGLPHLIFRNVLYMDTLPRFVGTALETGVVALPAGRGRVPFALRAEQGEAIANALLDAPCDNRTYELTGQQAYSFADVAAALTAMAGRPVRYDDVAPAAFAAQLVARGLPELVVRRSAGFLADIKNNQESTVSPELAALLGRAPTTLEAGLRKLYQQ